MVLGVQNRQALFGREIQHVFDLRDNPINSANAGEINHIRSLDRGKYVYAIWQAASPKNTPTATPASTMCSAKSSATVSKKTTGERGHDALNGEIEIAVELLGQNIAVLLQGETGTGKDHIARALHNASRYQSGPFVAIDCCSASVETLRCISQITGEHGDTVCPYGGTLFLNNVNLMSASLQAQLVEQMHQHEQGDDLSVNGFNIISACRSDLCKQVGAELFREDLFYRLAQYQLDIPPLRERAQREALIRHLLDVENARQGKQLALHSSAHEQLNSYHWPGNIRELQSTLRTAVTLCREEQISDAHLPAIVRKPPPSCNEANTARVGCDKGQWTGIEAAEYDVLVRELRQSRWNISATAKKLNMSRNTIYRKMEKYGITPDMDNLS